ALYGNLPFFTIAVGSTGHGGFAFAPGLNSLGYPTGGWGWTIGGVTVPGQFNAPNVSTINDGNWHHLVHVAQRSANCTTYLDGKQVDSTTIIESGDITMANAATIGQDPTGSYGVTAGAYIDDLAVWTNALTQLQISGMYLAGVSNAPGVSFAPAIAPKPHPVEMQVVQVGAQWQIQWAGGVGTLWSAPAVNGPWTAIQTNAASPYTIPMATPGTFYRLK
ncbi:MAG TPA: LamG-like jellyroll fold domain-containing protein, partial [Candidatus Acidoferrum sp.]|nr:LamG-like jellyroll fold domain-containing protein [Candidatus Acidoferrum sp.]